MKTNTFSTYVENKYICEVEKCFECSSESLSKDLCIKCNNNLNYYPKEEDILNNEKYIDCYKEKKGYYLDVKNLIFKKCYNSCEICEIKGDNIYHNCLKCNNNYSYEIKINNYKNCFSEQYNKIQDIIKDLLNNETQERQIEEEIQYYDTLIKNIDIYFTSEIYNFSDLYNGNNEIIKTKKMNIRLTTIKNQYNNKISTIIYIGKCEKILRSIYHISDNESLYLKKIEIFQKGMKIPKIEYDIYFNSSNNKLIKLNLSECEKDSKVYFSIPVKIVENIDKLNMNSRYYKDICYQATSDYGTDIILKDRKMEFIDGNKTLCQEDCDFVEYDYTYQRANCSCKVKKSSDLFALMNINKTKLYENFINIEKISNINILNCYKELFTKSGILKNIGFFVSISVIIFQIISMIIFYLKTLKIIMKKIKEIIFAIKHLDLLKTEEKEKTIKNKIIKRSKGKKGKILKKNNSSNIKPLPNTNNNKEKQRDKKKFKSKKINNIHINYNNNNFYNDNNHINNGVITKNITKRNKVNLMTKESKNNILDIKTQNKSINIKEKIKSILEYKNDEKNSLSYDLAIQYDKRTYCEYYISLLKAKHLLIFSFFTSDDYNSRIIKYELFLINFVIYYTVNAFFFTEENIHQIYEEQGSFNFIYQLPKIIYSSLIPIIFNTVLKLLALSNDSIIKFKQNRSKKNINIRGTGLKNKIKIKLVFYFIISFIVLSLSGYYLTLFGAVYINTQIHLLKDTLISFGISFIYPFILNLLPGIFRIISLSNEKKRRKCLYSFSKLIQKI